MKNDVLKGIVEICLMHAERLRWSMQQLARGC